MTDALFCWVLNFTGHVLLKSVKSHHQTIIIDHRNTGVINSDSHLNYSSLKKKKKTIADLIANFESEDGYYSDFAIACT